MALYTTRMMKGGYRHFPRFVGMTLNQGKRRNNTCNMIEDPEAENNFNKYLTQKKKNERDNGKMKKQPRLSARLITK